MRMPSTWPDASYKDRYLGTEGSEGLAEKGWIPRGIDFGSVMVWLRSLRMKTPKLAIVGNVLINDGNRVYLDGRLPQHEALPLTVHRCLHFPIFHCGVLSLDHST